MQLVLSFYQKYKPKVLTNKKGNGKHEQGLKNWHMHQFQFICCMVWKDKKPVLLSLIHAGPLPSKGENRPEVNCMVNDTLKKIGSSPMHVHHTRYMRGVDGIDQIRNIYWSLTWSHKWWHRVWSFFLDLSINYAWILHSELSFRFGKEPICHLTFYFSFYRALL